MPETWRAQRDRNDGESDIQQQSAEKPMEQTSRQLVNRREFLKLFYNIIVHFKAHHLGGT